MDYSVGGVLLCHGINRTLLTGGIQRNIEINRRNLVDEVVTVTSDLYKRRRAMESKAGGNARPLRSPNIQNRVTVAPVLVLPVKYKVS